MAPRFLLLYRGLEVPVRDTPLLMGRHPKCDLFVAGDTLISRRHAQFRWMGNGVQVEDLGSTNGVFVDGERLSAPRLLEGGEKVTVGSHEVSVVRLPATVGPEQTWDENTPSMPPPDLSFEPESAPGTTRRAEMLDVLFDLAEKSLAKGDIAAAERILGPYLKRMINRAENGDLSASQRRRAGHFAFELVKATLKGRWFDQLIGLHSASGALLPGDMVDALYDLVPKLDGVDTVSLKAYSHKLVASSSSLSPAERFVLRRIRGVENLASLK